MSENPEPFEPSLNSPYTPYTPNIPIVSIKLNTSNTSGFPISLKKLILTRWNARGGKRIEQLEQIRTDRIDTNTPNTQIIGMDRMGRIAQGVIGEGMEETQEINKTTHIT